MSRWSLLRRTARPVACATLLATLACYALAPHSAFGHQTISSTPAVGEIGEAPPPLRGSSEFFSTALGLLRPRCDEANSERLDEIERLLRDADRVRWGALPEADPRVSEHFRARAEQELVLLLASCRGVLQVDLLAPDASIANVDVDPRHSSLLLRVSAGEGPTELQVVDWDLASETFDRTTEVAVAQSGVTYILARLANVPEDSTTIRFALHRRGSPESVSWHGVCLKPPRWGRMALSIRDHQDRSTHALVSIRSAEGGVYFEPPGAVDLRAQLNDVVGPPISEPGLGYMFFLPGAKRGRYWVTPPDTEMTLPAGDWLVTVVRGPEQTPVVERVTIEPDGLARRELRVKDWIDMPARGWWSGDDHIHARLMSSADAGRLLDYAEAVDLHVANVLEMGDPYRTYYAQRGFGPEFRVARGDRWLVPGQEDPRSDLGHAIGLNLKRKVRDLGRYLQNDLLADQIHSDGGLYGHTHVGANACFVHREMALFTPGGIVDFNSIMQADLGTELYYHFLDLGFKMTASAGADTPYGGTVGAVRVYAAGGVARPFDPDRWFAAIKRGKTFVTNGPMLELTVAGAGPGETVAVDADAEINVRVLATGDPHWSAPQRLTVVQWGDEAAVAESADPAQGQLTLNTKLNAGDGCWVAASALGHDGSRAHTTPVYITVGDGSAGKGWHGDSKDAARLARRQLAVLKEIEQMLVTAEERVARGHNPLDLGTRQMAEQADAVRERIERARSSYQAIIDRSELVQR